MRETPLLDARNANAAKHRRDFRGWTVEPRYAVGKVGRARAGSKIHLLNVELVVAVTDEADERHVGRIHSAASPCNGNGQHVGQVVRGLDLDAITCTTCRRVARLEG